MITAKGYSKDPNIVPEGIAITFGKEMINEQGGLKTFLTQFLEVMNDNEDGRYWMHKCKNLPTADIDHIYIIVHNRLYARVYCGGMHRYSPDSPAIYGYSANGRKKLIDWNHIILSGPMERCPFKRELKGFQGFRYTTKLW